MRIQKKGILRLWCLLCLTVTNLGFVVLIIFSMSLDSEPQCWAFCKAQTAQVDDDNEGERFRTRHPHYYPAQHTTRTRHLR